MEASSGKTIHIDDQVWQIIEEEIKFQESLGKKVNPNKALRIILIPELRRRGWRV